MIFETGRLFTREFTPDDFGNLCRTLQDPEVMYAYEHAFSDAEAADWLQRQIKRYAEDGFGLWAVVLKGTGRVIGQCGLTLQDWNGQAVPEIGYLFEKAYWRRGYAIEAAKGCKEYAFRCLGLPRVYSIIRENNLPSRKVAEKNGMRICGSLVKHYSGRDMTHLVFCAENGECREQNGG